MATQTVEAPMRVTADRSRGLSLVLVGGLFGLAWAAGMRGFMAQIVQGDSSVSWSGTFGYILLPGLLVGLLLGWAEHLRRTGGERRWRWLALSPVLFAAVVFSEGPLGVLGIFEDGLGGGAIGRTALRHGRRVRDLRTWPPLGPTRLRRAGPDRHSDLGSDRRVLRRSGPGCHHTPRTVGRSVLLLIPRTLHDRCRHPAPTHCRHMMRVGGRASTFDRGLGPRHSAPYPQTPLP